MSIRNKITKAEKSFHLMCQENKRQHNIARRLLHGIYLTIAEEMIADEEIQIKIGDKLYPNENSLLDNDDDFIAAIMKADKGTQITLIRDGAEFGSYGCWETYNPSICKGSKCQK